MRNNLQRVLCNNCSGWTLHERLFEHVVHEPLIDDETGDEVAEIVEQWEVFRCLGCGGLTLRTTEEVPSVLRTRIMESTVGFLKRP